MITKNKIDYIETMTKELVSSLKEVLKQHEKEKFYMHASEHRAKFKRLRVELTKELMNVQNDIYKN